MLVWLINDMIPCEVDWSPSEGSGCSTWLLWRVLQQCMPRSRQAAGQGWGVADNCCLGSKPLSYFVQSVSIVHTSTHVNVRAKKNNFEVELFTEEAGSHSAWVLWLTLNALCVWIKPCGVLSINSASISYIHLYTQAHIATQMCTLCLILLINLLPFTCKSQVIMILVDHFCKVAGLSPHPSLLVCHWACSLQGNTVTRIMHVSRKEANFGINVIPLAFNSGCLKA